MKLAYSGLPTDIVRDLKKRGRDAYDLPIENHVSDGNIYPCRHCLGAVPKGASYLILAHRPFGSRCVRQPNLPDARLHPR